MNIEELKEKYQSKRDALHISLVIDRDIIDKKYKNLLVDRVFLLDEIITDLEELSKDGTK
jgi:hypothetical protein